MSKTSKTFIVSFWNENSVGSMIHTFAVHADENGLLYSYNGYGDADHSYENFADMILFNDDFNDAKLISAYYLY